jgi:NAD(P)-dependent dehydrogenase (short-subunit alcohol dehydrogenase family)
MNRGESMNPASDFVGKRILVAGASSDLARDLVGTLVSSGATLGLHYHTKDAPLRPLARNEKVRLFQKDLSTARACTDLVDEFVAWSGGIDALVQLTGNIHRTVYWAGLTEEDWQFDLGMNLVMPFFLAARGIFHMKAGGRIVLTSTASAAHGGGTSSLAYGVAKAGIECVVKRLARDCAEKNILVNAIAPGFIPTKFHTDRMGRSPKELAERVKLIPMKRSGTPGDVAGTILFLLSDHASYITGQVIAISGGDFL